MKQIAFSLFVAVGLTCGAFAGTETYSSSKEIQQTAPEACDWYKDKEWNVSLWGTFAFTGSNGDWDNEYLRAENGWGGGMDIKYFFHKNWGVGLQGFLLSVDAADERFVEVDFFTDEIVDVDYDHDQELIGAVLGTFTFRWPIGCSRFAPYLWAGAGGIFGGGERSTDFFFSTVPGNPQVLPDEDSHTDSSGEFIGQIGGGFEVRITPRVGWINDVSWNFISRDDSSFGMIRSGINFAF